MESAGISTLAFGQETNGVAGVFDHPDVVRLVQILRDIEPRTAA
jgi:hypothetical protein